MVKYFIFILNIIQLVIQVCQTLMPALLFLEVVLQGLLSTGWSTLCIFVKYPFR